MTTAATQGLEGLDHGPPPSVDQEIWVEGLVGAPLGSIVVGVEGEVVRLEPPRVAGHDVPLPLGQDFKITYRVRGVRCEVRAVMVQAPTPQDRHYAARMTAPPTRIQRRQDVRVPANLQVILRDATEGADPDEKFPATTVNVSVSGLLISSSHEIAGGGTFHAALNCGQQGLLPMRIRVVWVQADERMKTWQAGMRILDIEPEDRRRLSAYVLDRQRVLRRRELGLE